MQGSLVPVVFGVFVHGFAAPPAGCAVGVVVEESGAGFVVCPASALLGFGEFAVLHVGLGSLGVCWWMCEGSNLMDQRVLAFVKVGLWLADCSPVESHPLLHRVVDAECSSRCVVVLAVACSDAMFFALRCCVVAELSVPASQCVPRSTSLLFACFTAAVLLCCRAHAAVLTVACSDAMFFALLCQREWFACPMLRPCVPVVPCPVPWPVVAGVWVWVPWSRRGWGCWLPLGCSPFLAGCLASRGWGCFLAGIKITPRPSSWKVDGVGVHFMLTNSIHPGVTVALPAAPTTSVLGRVGRGFACRACLLV